MIQICKRLIIFEKKTTIKKLLFPLLFCVSLWMQGQDSEALYTDKPIKIDGEIDDSWNKVADSSPFWEYFPSDSIPANPQTNVKFLYDEQNLYVLIIAERGNEEYITPSLRRDFSSRNSDSVTLVLDTFNDGTNAFIFGTNPEGVQREALLSNGGNSFPRDFNMSWDVKWQNAVKKTSNGYISELKIPLSSIRYSENSTEWGVNVYRSEIASNRTSSWANIPRNQSIAGIAFMKTLKFEKPLQKAKVPFAIIPFSSGIVSKDFDQDISNSSLSFGGDAKVNIGDGMILDLTLNPDFSQVEVDDQIINLTRFEVRLPEKRQFFIQNSDLFENFGDRWETQPFFSRRIGVAKDLDGNTIENKIVAGARLSGKLNDNLRIGLLNMQTAEDAPNGIAGNNNTVVSLQHKMFSRSYLGFIFVNRQQTDDISFETDQEEYNRVVGLDYTLASKNNQWTGRSFIHQSFLPNQQNDAYSFGTRLNYNSRKHSIRYVMNRIGEGFQSDLGFLRRTGIHKQFLKYGHRFWIDAEKIRSIQLSQQIYYVDLPKSNGLVTDKSLSTEGEIDFADSSRFDFEYNRRYTYLISDFNPLGADDAIAIPGEQGYYYNDLRLRYSSNFSRKLNYNFSATIGEFYNGKKISLRSEFSLRLQPKFNGSIKINYDKIDLPAPYTSGELWLVGPKFDVTFSKSIFWNTFIQYSSQSENLGINSRLQWRFAPLSDFYIVYNDNYLATTTFVPKVRSLTFKLTYWLNL